MGLPAEDSERKSCSSNLKECPNLLLSIIGGFFFYGGYSVWSISLLSNIIFLIDHSSFRIGIVEGVQGAAALVFAIPAGILADKWRKHLVLKIGCIVELIGLASLFLVIFYATQATTDNLPWFYWPFLGAVSLSGIGIGIMVGPEATLFTNSVATGGRSFWLSVRFVVFSIGFAFGPAVVAILFKSLGREKWSLLDLCVPFYVSLGISGTGCLILLFMNDAFCLKGKEIESIKSIVKSKVACLRSRHVPVICVSIKFLTVIGSGMTVKFFPLFFQNVANFSPVDLQVLFVFSYVAIAGLTILAKLVADKLGRVQTLIIFRFGSLIALAALLFGKGVYWQVLWLIGILYVLRISFANCLEGIHQSLVDDFVLSTERSKWNSLEFLVQMGWSGSALLGGFLVEKVGYQWTFLVTLVVQLVATCGYFLLVGIVPRKELNLRSSTYPENERTMEDEETVLVVN